MTRSLIRVGAIALLVGAVAFVLVPLLAFGQVVVPLGQPDIVAAAAPPDLAPLTHALVAQLGAVLPAWAIAWLQLAGLVVMIASAIVAATPTPAPGTWQASAYRVLELLAIVVGRAKQVGRTDGLRALAPVLLLIGLAGLLSACAALQSPELARVNASAATTEAEVCRTWGLVHAIQVPLGVATPAALVPAEDALAVFCSADPVIGATPPETLATLAAYALELAAARAPPR